MRKPKSSRAEKLRSRKIDKLTDWQDARLTTWQKDRMTRCKDDNMTRWHHYRTIGWFLFRKVLDIQFCMFPCWSHCFTGFRTVFVFALGRFLPMLVIFFWLQWELQSSHMVWWPDGHTWPNMAKMAIYGHLAIGPHATNMAKRGIPEKSYKNVAQQC